METNLCQIRTDVTLAVKLYHPIGNNYVIFCSNIKCYSYIDIGQRTMIFD